MNNFGTTPNGYTHKFVTRDGPMTSDRMLGILVLACYRAWENWNSLAPIKIQGISEPFDSSMQHLRREIGEAEIFLSGLIENKKD